MKKPIWITRPGEIVGRALLIAVILSNAMFSTPANAQATAAVPPAGPAAAGPTAGLIPASAQVPADPAAGSVIQPAAPEKTLPAPVQAPRLKVSAAPAIYIPGKPVQVSWTVTGLPQAAPATGANAVQVSIQAPGGVHPVDAGLGAAMTPAGMLSLPASNTDQHAQWAIGPGAQFPLYFGFSLSVGGQITDQESVMIDKARYQIGAGGGSIAGENGQVQVDVPAGAAGQPLAFDV